MARWQWYYDVDARTSLDTESGWLHLGLTQAQAPRPTPAPTAYWLNREAIQMVANCSFERDRFELDVTTA